MDKGTKINPTLCLFIIKEKSMKLIKLLLAFTLVFCFTSKAFASDIRILGVKYDSENGKRSFVHYDPFTDEVTLNKDVPFLNFVLGTSTFDPSTSNYYISTWAVMQNEKRIFGIFSKNGEIVNELDTKLNVLTETEFDFKTGELCGFVKGGIIDIDTLNNDTIVGLNFVKINPKTEEVNVLSEIKEFNATVLNTSCYNSNKAIYIVAAVDIKKDEGLRIFWIDAKTGDIINKTEPLNYNLGELLYDNKNDRLIGYKHDNDGGLLVSIDEKGEATPISDFKIKGYVASNTAFDQQNSLFIASILEENSTSMQTIVINTLNGNVESNINTEYQINEWEIDNTDFANKFYVKSSIENNSNEGLYLSPNPVTSNFISLNGITNKVNLRIFNLLGIELVNREIIANQKIDVSLLENGVYTAIISSPDSIKEVPFIISK